MGDARISFAFQAASCAQKAALRECGDAAAVALSLRWMLLGPGDRDRVEAHLASFLRLYRSAPSDAAREAWAAYDALCPRRPEGYPAGDWRRRVDCNG